MLRAADALIAQRLARNGARKARELRARYWAGTGDIEDTVAAEVAGKRRRIGACTIGARHVVVAAVTGRAGQHAEFQCCCVARPDQKIRVDVVTQDRPLERARSERLLGPVMIIDQRAFGGWMRRRPRRIDDVGA